MTSDTGERVTVRGHAAFNREYDDFLAPWMERFASELLVKGADGSDRLRLLHWALLGVVRLLDEEGVYSDSGWMINADNDIRGSAFPTAPTKVESQLRRHLGAAGVPAATPG